MLSWLLGPKCPRCGSRDSFVARTSPVLVMACRPCSKAATEEAERRREQDMKLKAMEKRIEQLEKGGKTS